MAAQMHAPAFEFVTSLAAELSTRTVELPGFPQVVERVRRALADPAHTAAQTARMIGAEPALAAKVLAIANSAAFTCAGKPVTELRTAVLRLGDNLLRSTALSFAMAQLRHQSTLRSIEPRLQSLWKQSTNVAAICYGLARRASLCPDEGFLVGLLHGVGKLYVIVRASNHPRLFEDAAAFENILSGWHVSIARAILENWNFPDRMVDAVADQNDSERKHYGNADLTDVLICATRMSQFCERVGELPTTMLRLDAFRALNLGAVDCLAVLEQAHLRVSELRIALGE